MKSNRRIFIVFLFLFQGMLHGQYFFGRNKIQYHHFNWQILETKHFQIYFYPEMEELAEIGAAFAEESYHDLQNKFNHSILQKIPLVFYSSHFHFEETNTLPYHISPGLAGFFEFIKGRVVVPSDGNLHRFRQTIRHELVHVFTRSYIERVMKDRRLMKSVMPPLWFTEGLAEYWSHDWSTEAEMFIRDGVLNNTIVPLPSIYRINGTYMLYKEGQALCKYISEKYGDEKLLLLMDNIWRKETFSNVVETVLGKDYKELSNEWLYDLKKSIYPLMLKKDLPSMMTRRITEKGVNTLPAYYLDEGEPTVVFVANRDGYSSIYRKRLVDHKTEKPEILIRGEKSADLESFRLLNGKIDIDHEGQLLFVAKSGAQDALYIYNIPQKKIVRTLHLPGLVSIYSPSWSPDSRRIAISGLDMHGRADLYVIDVETEKLSRLTHDFHHDGDPCWSPDGRYLVFSSGRTPLGKQGFSNLFLLNVETGRVQYLTYGPYHDVSPAWSPDGRSIAFASDRDSVSNIWRVFVDEFAQKPAQWAGMETGGWMTPGQSLPPVSQVTRFATGVFTPVWTNHGTLLFTAFEKMQFQIRELKELPSPETLHPVSQPVQPASTSPWEFPKISGDLKRSTLKYKKKFSLDFAQSQVIQDPFFGTSGGGQLVISDMLGDEKYYFVLFNNARTSREFWKSFNFALTRIDLSHRLNYGLGLYRFAGRYYNRYEGFYEDNRIGALGSLSYPLSKFARVETRLNVRNSVKDRYDGHPPRKALLTSGFISYTFDNSLWGPTGPLDGQRFRLTLGHTIDVKHDNVHFSTIQFDLRKYFRIGYRVAHAVRVWGEFNNGKEATPYFMGGSWDLRGYKFWSLWGTRLAFVSNEFRFPFIDQLYLGFPFGGIGFSSIRGALFFDAGNVWDGDFNENDIKGSFGLGFRMNFGGAIVLRLDMGRRTDFKTVENHTFTQFFFGWDF